MEKNQVSPTDTLKYLQSEEYKKLKEEFPIDPQFKESNTDTSKAPDQKR